MTDSNTEPEPEFRRRRRSFVLPFVRCVVWLFCLLWTVFIVYATFLDEKQSKLIEGNLEGLIFLIGGYIFASAVDKVTRCWEP